MIIRFLRILCVGIVMLCGCAKHHESQTFREKYNVYAEPVPVLNNPVTLFPGADHNLMGCIRRFDLPIEMLEAYVDAIARRMDAKTLEEYLEINEEVHNLCDKLMTRIGLEDHPFRGSDEGACYRELARTLDTHTEWQLEKLFSSLQQVKYQMNLTPSK